MTIPPIGLAYVAGVLEQAGYDVDIVDGAGEWIDESHPMSIAGEDFRIAMLEALSAIFTLPATEQPVMMLLEDWHWADDASREVLLQLTSMLAAFAMLVIVTYRPEGEFDWGRGSERRHLALEPLSEESSVEVIKSVLGVQSFPADLAQIDR